MIDKTGHPIRVVANRTGLSPHVIRIWERRYQAVTPWRTPTNRRLYTDDDIERLKLLHQAIEHGHSIGRIADLPLNELNTLVQTDRAAAWSQPPSNTADPVAAASKADPADYVAQCMAAVQQLDAATLEDLLARASVELSQVKLIEQIIEPLMQQIGDMWEDGSLRVADEHLASAVVRSFVGSLKSAYRVPDSASGIVFTTPTGQVHEIGALLAATTAAAAGWKVTYLGPNLPAAEIAGAVQKNGARAVALSIIHPADDPHLGTELLQLRHFLADDVALLVGGRAAPGYRHYLDQMGAYYLANLEDLRLYLKSTGGAADA